MKHSGLPRLLMALGIISGLLACGREIPTDSSAGQIGFAPQRLEACGGGIESDPHPSSPGIFLCSLITSDYCLNGGNSDVDGDGVADYCEEQLSYAFRPELRFWSVDDVRREPYWVARTDSAGRIVMGYLLGYYRDAGEDAWGCHTPILFIPPPASCNGHNGDSESLWLTVHYNATTQHWVLENAYYSVHDGWVWRLYDSGLGYATGVEYPVSPAGGYPRVWISEGKHANYFTQYDCNTGGDFRADDCSYVDSYTRFEWSASWNLGSLSHPFVNGILSRNPDWYPGSARTECFWTSKRFRGWIPDYVGGDDSDPYLDKLVQFGFSTFTGIASCSQQQPPPPRPLSVSIGINGPYYTAVGDGGHSPYTYLWEACATDCEGGEMAPSASGSVPDGVAHGWLNEGNSQQLYWTSPQWNLRVTVTDATSAQVQAEHLTP